MKQKFQRHSHDKNVNRAHTHKLKIQIKSTTIPCSGSTWRAEPSSDGSLATLRKILTKKYIQKKH